jgi:parvulin-like peptidyl-prolyl isomerase
MFINGEFVDDALIRQEAAALKEGLRAESIGADPLTIEIKAREVAREVIIEQVILRQVAEKVAVPTAALEAALAEHDARAHQRAGCLLPRDREELRSRMLFGLRIEQLFTGVAAEVAKPGYREIQDFYRFAKASGRPSFLHPETIHAGHIVKNVDESTSEADALAAIRRIQSLLQNGKPFEAVADEYSDCPGGGGDLGFIQRGEMVEEFDEVVFALRAGEVSAIFRSPFGFHLAKVYARKAERLPALKEVRPLLEDLLWNAAKKKAVGEFLAGLRANAEVRKSK